jgi:hypothetical protein
MIGLEDRRHPALTELLDDSILTDVFAWLEGHAGGLRPRLDDQLIILKATPR